MPQSDSVSKKLADAKSTLADSYKKIPPMSTTPAPSPAAQPKSPAPVTKPPSISDELAAKKANVDQYTASLPKMHRGGEVKADGAYQLKKGEHVLTPKEAKVAHKHALMMSGLKSMAKSYTAGDTQKAGPAKTMAKSGSTSGEPKLKFPEPSEGPQIHVKTPAKSISTSGKSQKAEPGKVAAKGPATKGQPVKITATSSSKPTKGIVVRPEKNQAAQIPQQMER
jgi:hypothetical protein